ncbi:probable cytochrome P450 49a1 [Aphidius gifuensis]|uniref:probable cytochrome P450 49a1 n=1 Tax=Aphidius gifuensis TaxID=684658 RepID=UPI001CDB88B7|nr:probable cytochrome P450 49a1 [Aphidius gifuensis]
MPYECLEPFDEKILSVSRSYTEIPGPKPVPFFGNTWRFIPIIGDFNIQSIDKVSKQLHENYGDIVKIGGLLGRPDMVFLYDANEIEKVYRQEERMPYRPSMPSLNYYKHKLRKNWFNEEAGVIGNHGESWYNFRSKVQQVMLQPRVAHMYIGAIEESSQAFINRIEKIKDHHDETPDDFLNEIHKWSVESIAQVALNVKLDCMSDNSSDETQELIDAIHTFFTNVGILELKIPFWKIFNTPTWKNYVKSLDTIFNFTTKYCNIAMKKSKNNKKCPDEFSLLERILEIKGDTKLASVLAFDLFLVGIDTTSNAIASVLLQLASHPEKQLILHNEIMKILPSKNMKINPKNIEDLKYLKSCIKETLRLYPVVIGNGRCMTKDTIINGYHVPKGVQVIFQHCIISNKEKYFPHCNEYLPERWMSESERRHPFASLPFGYGRRMCLGRRFADLEMLIVLIKIIQHYKLEYKYEKLDYYINPVYTPKGPLKIKFIKRN